MSGFRIRRETIVLMVLFVRNAALVRQVNALSRENAELRQQHVEDLRRANRDMALLVHDYHDLRKAFDTLWSNALVDLQRPI